MASTESPIASASSSSSTNTLTAVTPLDYFEIQIWKSKTKMNKFNILRSPPIDMSKLHAIPSTVKQKIILLAKRTVIEILMHRDKN